MIDVIVKKIQLNIGKYPKYNILLFTTTENDNLILWEFVPILWGG